MEALSADRTVVLGDDERAYGDTFTAVRWVLGWCVSYHLRLARPSYMDAVMLGLDAITTSVEALGPALFIEVDKLV